MAIGSTGLRYSMRRTRAGASRTLVTRNVVKLPVLSVGQRLQYALLVCLFAGSALYFWTWWLAPEQRGNPALYWLMTASTGSFSNG